MKIDEEQILNEEVERIKNNSMFTGVNVSTDLYFKFQDKLDREKLRQIKDAVESPALAEALANEVEGYSKPNMNEEELETERQLFDKNLSLDFMLESDEEKDDLTQGIIHRELNKTTHQKVEDHKRFEGNMFLMCDSVNGYIKSALHLLSLTKKFVRFFLRANYQK